MKKYSKILIHYNHNHDKLGRFSSGNSLQAVRYTRLLNSNQKKRDKEYAKEMKADYKYRKNSENSKKTINKILSDNKRTRTRETLPNGKDGFGIDLTKRENRKIKKTIQNQEKLNAERFEHFKASRFIDRVNEASIYNIQATGRYEVYERDVVRNTQKGKDFVALMLGDNPNARVKREQEKYARYNGETPSSINSKEYLVKKKK